MAEPRILVLRGGALGDFIVTLPALLALRERWPRAWIELVGNATAAELARTRGLLDAVHSQHEGRWRALFDAAPLPSGLNRWLTAFDVVVNYWPDPDRALAHHFPVRTGQVFVTAPAMPTQAPAAAHYGAALRPLGIEATSTFVSLTPDRASTAPWSGNEDPVNADVAPGGAHPAEKGPERTWIAAHPGSGSMKKNWPRERWIELLAELPDPVLLITGETEAGNWNDPTLRGAKLADRVRNGSLRHAANLPLEKLVAELARCRLFIGHDSGVSHLAAACGVPCLLLFGPTSPDMWAPPAPHVRVIHRGADLAAIAVADVQAAIARS